ncbi:cellulose binding domain-containing protein [Micromonospora psammae]|uniref:cellulose binding domain-containing protein n=1 Tax=Micromonospora sp. CPCC 205556 TaxID=3122398 RepID=UPI002FF24B44
MSGTRRARPSSGHPTVLASSPWLVVVTGVVVMVVLLIVALLSSAGQRTGLGAGSGEPAATVPLPPLPPASPSPAGATLPAPVTPGLSPRRSDAPSPTAPAPIAAAPAPSGGGGAQPRPPRPPAPSATVTVTGRYRVLESWGDGFIGEVLLTNSGASARPWTVRLELPRGEVVTSWVEGAPQGSARMADGVFTYTSGADVAGGASVPLRFHVDRTGGNTRPSSCTVDGKACGGL